MVLYGRILAPRQIRQGGQTLRRWLFLSSSKTQDAKEPPKSAYQDDDALLAKVDLPPCVGVDKTTCSRERLDKDVKSPKVIIVGAGLAGLSAAQRLAESGVTDITIFEAANRLGGRVYTCEFEGHPVDLGAQWIRGASIANAIFNIAMQHKLLTSPLKISEPFRGIFLLSSGSPVCSKLQAKSLQIMKALVCSVKQLSQDPSAIQVHINDSIWDYMVKHIELETCMLHPKEATVIRNVLLAIMNCLKAEIGADLCDVPVERFACQKDCLGGNTHFRDGFNSVLKPLSASVPKESIKLGKEVCSIKWANTTPEEGRVHLKTNDGATYDADYVIVTVSLGVLKNRHKILFSPSLPPDKIEAIDNVGYGDINKVFLSYDKPFWVEGEGTIRVCWDWEEIQSTCTWIRSVGLIEEVPNNPKVLMFTIGGPAARCVEDLSPRCLAIEVTRLIQKVMNNHALPTPQKIMRSRWRADRLFLGASSYLTNQTFIGHLEILGEALPKFCDSPAPALLFAGEATVPGMNGTAHGARFSGIREAERIIEITKRFRGSPPRPKSNVC